ncbi:S1C family serine protease [Paractinoplanes hotanensis]|uniref:Trypsin-like peptidase domain-containing protein n=1 Tax=Paractinoplanes hotanensis TaxID=2906497 RepID=A0ABT0YB46_9ACTN|nr:trypsin-like peptidase domain-containing protein [Actinoplanes hotanensis]MCM4083263.1 trypsin-like peptidase domain-containing protein [Actinoplanes hotanensis]
MTMTYEPFTPAGSDEQRRYDGRRRAEQPPEAPERGQWGEPARDQRWSEPVPADPWAESAAQPGWSEPAPQQAWEPAPQQRAPQQRAPQPEPRVQQWGGDQHWEPAAPLPRQRHTGEQPAWHTGLTPAVQAPAYEPEPAPPRAGGATRLKPAIIGVVTLLLLVAGWQAYRIEGMSRHNQDLAAVLSAEQGRTDQLEKKLAGVFDPEAVSSGVLPSVFRVRAGGFTGTAFSVGKKATGNQANLITNYHVVAETWTDGGRKVSLERGSTRISATIVKVDKGKDLALLRANQKIAGLSTSTNQVKPGQQVVVVGAPLGLDDSVTTGVISAYRPNDADGPTVQFDAPINPGNSGGPVVNANEQVVGVATAKAKDAEGIGLAIPIKTACDTLQVC